MSYNIEVKRAHETERWYLDGVLHRISGPAIISDDGTTHWYRDGRLHRDDGPAIEYADGIKQWYQNGTYQRTSVKR